jgi:hypothetical protein
MGAMVRVYDGLFRIISHTTGSQQVSGAVALDDGKAPALLSSCGIEEFHPAVLHKLQGPEGVRMRFVCHADRRQTPSIFNDRIKTYGVGLHSEHHVMGERVHRAGKVPQIFFELEAPLRHVGREAALCETGRVKFKARVEARTPEKAMLRVYFIEVVNDSADSRGPYSRSTDVQRLRRT